MFFLSLPDTVETKHQYQIVASWNRQKDKTIVVGEINRPDTDHDGAASVGRSVWPLAAVSRRKLWSMTRRGPKRGSGLEIQLVSGFFAAYNN